ncbi:hypothetical protein Hanom_Chr06g00493141 [Helianthus anomalus]
MGAPTPPYNAPKAPYIQRKITTTCIIDKLKRCHPVWSSFT